jgi:hypothetical protein
VGYLLSLCRALRMMRLGSFQIALHIFHPVLLQEHLNLFPKRHLAMMFGLALNVFLIIFFRP